MARNFSFTEPEEPPVIEEEIRPVVEEKKVAPKIKATIIVVTSDGAVA